jgi:hypothetical protein
VVVSDDVVWHEPWTFVVTSETVPPRSDGFDEVLGTIPNGGSCETTRSLRLTRGMAMDEATSGLERCPGCGNKDLIAVSVGEQTNFFCDVCVLCWHPEQGRASLVEPDTCPGCQMGKTGCLGAVGSLHSRW